MLFFWEKHTWRRAVLIGIFLINGVAIFFSGTRGAMQRPSSGACCMSPSNIDTGRVTLSLTSVSQEEKTHRTASSISVWRYSDLSTTTRVLPDFNERSALLYYDTLSSSSTGCVQSAYPTSSVMRRHSIP